MFKFQDNHSFLRETVNTNDNGTASILPWDNLIETFSDTLPKIVMLEVMTLKEELIVTKNESKFHRTKCLHLEQEFKH